MAIKSSISIDNSSDQSAVLILQKDMGTLTKFTYSNKDNSIKLEPRTELILDKNELGVYIDQLYNFHKSLIKNFKNLDSNKYLINFKIDWEIDYKKPLNKIDFSFSKNNFKILEISTDMNKNKVTLAERKKEAVMSYAEWNIYIYLLNFYENQLP